MSGALEEAVRAAAAPLHVPGQPDWRIISPAQVEAIAGEQELPRRQVEIAALEAEIVPLPYMRNLARYAIRGQLELLRTSVTVVGLGLPTRKCLQNLAAHGVGRIRVLTPASPSAQALDAGTRGAAGFQVLNRLNAAGTDGSRQSDITPSDAGLAMARRLAAEVTNLNASLETSVDALDLRRGDPSAALGEPDVVVACLEEMAEEMLLQVACQRRQVPLVVGGLQGDRAQATTVLPGDAGIALVYRDEQPHLDRSRPGSLTREPERTAGRLVRTGATIGTWLADQVIALRLGLGELLQNRLLYADMGSGEMQTFPLGR
jgi:molybdopterin/thiamine biosynthesis adenylyltransferase